MNGPRGLAAVLVALTVAACSGGSSGSTAAAPTPRPAPDVGSPAMASGSHEASPGASRQRQATAATTSAPVTTSQRPIPTRSPNPFAGNADNGKTMHLKVGQQLRVRLEGAWTIPVASAPAVLKRGSVKQRAEFVRVVFLAVGRGTSAVTAKTSSGAQKSWRIQVVVG